MFGEMRTACSPNSRSTSSRSSRISTTIQTCVDSLFAYVFNLAKTISNETENYDMTVAPLVNAWGFSRVRHSPQFPDSLTIDQPAPVRENIDKIQLNAEEKSCDSRPTRASMLDFSSIAKVSAWLMSPGCSTTKASEQVKHPSERRYRRAT